MGVLDDAIREHLELKRAHGADESELRRKEDEALGPARREVTEAEAADSEPTAAQAEELAAAELAEDTAAAPPPADDGFFEGDEPFAEAPPLTDEPPAAEAPPLAPEDALPPAEEEPLAYEDELPPVAEEQAPAVEHAPPPVDDEPPFFEDDAPFEDDPAPPVAGAGAGPAPPAGEEDVLEETPEFLQETPEHDRLWFEQKPPRDFDFDDDDR